MKLSETTMWIRYLTIVSFISMLASYGAALALGWSISRSIPGMRSELQAELLAYSIATVIIASPVWFFHWRWAKRDWPWGSENSQRYLAFFTVVGLLATVVIGVQFFARSVELMVGSRKADNDSVNYLLGALWSLIVSLGLWLYHGNIWLKIRRRSR